MSAGRFPWAVDWVLFGLIALVAMLPVFTIMISAAIANTYGCTIGEGLLTPCIIDGKDWGSTLQFGGMSVFYVFLTWPLVFVLFIIGVMVLQVHRARFKQRTAA